MIMIMTTFFSFLFCSGIIFFVLASVFFLFFFCLGYNTETDVVIVFFLALIPMVLIHHSLLFYATVNVLLLSRLPVWVGKHFFSSISSIIHLLFSYSVFFAFMFWNVPLSGFLQCARLPTNDIIKYFSMFSKFLVAFTRLYTPLCLSVHRLVGWLVGLSVGPSHFYFFYQFYSVLEYTKSF